MTWITDLIGSRAFDRLANELSSSQLTSLLLELVRARAAQRTPAEVLRQFERNGVCQPAAVDPRAAIEIDADLFAIASGEGFESIELSPVAPLGTCSTTAPTDQNRVLSALRATEIVADPTNVLALECARRLRARPGPAVHLATSQRVVRMQPVPERPGFAPHFRLFALASAGREREDHAFTIESLACHAQLVLRALARLEGRGYLFGVPEIEVLATRERGELGDRIVKAITTAALAGKVSRKELDHPYYSGGLRYTIWATAADGERVPLADGGAFDWIGRLLSNRRAVYTASALGTQLIALRFGPGDRPGNRAGERGGDCGRAGDSRAR